MKKWMIICIAFLLSCVSENPHMSIQNITDKEIDDLQIADDFEFATSREVEVSIQDADENAVYTVYLYNDESISFEYITHTGDDGTVLRDTVQNFDDSNQQVAMGKIVDGWLRLTLDVPAHIHKLYLVRRHNRFFSSAILDIQAAFAAFHYNELGKVLAAGDTLIAVNSDGELFGFSPETLDRVEWGELPDGASAVAFDNLNNILYVICDKEKHVPLYKYDLAVQEFELVDKLKQNFYRLAFNPHDGFLYAGYKKFVFIIDPGNGKTLSKLRIKDLKKDDGGDYVFDQDGNLYLACESGLYELSLSKNKYYAQELSKEVRDFEDASGAAFDSDGLLWISQGDDDESDLWVWNPDKQTLKKTQSIEREISDLNLNLEKRVRARTHELKLANRELESFSYSVSHDLRAPLRAIDGWAQVLAEDYAPLFDEPGRQAVDRLRGATQRMGALIDDLLQLSRVNRQELERQPVSMDQLVRTVLQQLESATAARPLSVTVQPLPDCSGSPTLLTQIWTNLIGNAVKFTAKRENPQVVVGSETSAEGETVYFVKDNGAGFNMKYAAKLFGAFQRLHSAREFAGTGIGLALSQRIVHRHRGRIWAEGEVGEGATFFFTIPDPDAPDSQPTSI